MFLDTVYIYDIFENDFIQLLLHATLLFIYFLANSFCFFIRNKVYYNTYAGTGYILTIMMYLYNNSYF